MASFKQMQAAGVVKRADANQVELENIHEEPGFNLRAEGEDLDASIRDLADHIKRGGKYPALEVRPRDEGGVFVVDGHRRRRALLLALSEGAPITNPKDGKNWIHVVPFEGSDADRTLRILTSAKGKPLDPLEVAEGYKRLRAFGWSPEQIAVAADIKAPQIRNLMKLGDANSDVKKLGEKAGQVVKAALKTAPKGKVTAGVLQQDQKAAKKAALAKLEEDATLFRVMVLHCKLDEGMLGETTLVFPEGLGEHTDLRSLAQALLLNDVAQ